MSISPVSFNSPRRIDDDNERKAAVSGNLSLNNPIGSMIGNLSPDSTDHSSSDQQSPIQGSQPPAPLQKLPINALDGLNQTQASTASDSANASNSAEIIDQSRNTTNATQKKLDLDTLEFNKDDFNKDDFNKDDEFNFRDLIQMAVNKIVAMVRPTSSGA